MLKNTVHMFEVDTELPLNNNPQSDTTLRTYLQKDVDGSDLYVPVNLTNVKIILTTVRISGTPWNMSRDLDFPGPEVDRTFTKVSDGWEIEYTFDALTGKADVIDPAMSTTLKAKISEVGVPVSFEITGKGSLDAVYRTPTKEGRVVRGVIYEIHDLDMTPP